MDAGWRKEDHKIRMIAGYKFPSRCHEPRLALEVSKAGLRQKYIMILVFQEARLAGEYARIRTAVLLPRSFPKPT